MCNSKSNWYNKIQKQQIYQRIIITCKTLHISNVEIVVSNTLYKRKIVINEETFLADTETVGVDV